MNFMAQSSTGRESSEVCVAVAARRGSTWHGVIVFAAAVAISLAATSGRSLWIDEACTAIRAIQPTLDTWWQAMEQERTGCLQMPLYMLYTWAWARLFGSSEWSFHLANLPWFAAGAAAFIMSFPVAGRRRVLAGCLALFCPFAWYYMDEARPYAIQLGASLLIVASLRRIAHGGGAGEARYVGPLVWFLTGIVVLCGTSLFGTVWTAGAMGVLLILVPPRQLAALVKAHLWLWLAAAIPLVGLAVYYIWTLTIGARGSGAATTTLGSMFFVGYELLGFAGLGPGRLALRSAGLTALHGYWAPVVLYALAAVPPIGAALWHGLKLEQRKHLAIALCCCAPPLVILAAGWAVHFRVLGRHLAPFVSVLLLLFTLGAAALWSQRGPWARLPVICFCLLGILSCLSLRFAARHEKDDYRAAATMAKAALARGDSVWWNAAQEGAIYYGVPVTTGATGNGRAVFMMNPTRESLGALPPPALIVASKPDLYDGQMALAKYIREQGYCEGARFAAFVLWERKRR